MWAFIVFRAREIDSLRAIVAAAETPFQVHVWFGAEGDARVSESFETREKADGFAAYYAAEWAGEATTAIFAGGRRLDVSAG